MIRQTIGIGLLGILASSAPLWAQAGNPQGPGLIGLLLPFLFIFVVFYFLIILPQSRQEKKRKQMLAALKKGDRVVTTGGLIGQIVKVDNETVSLRVAKEVVVKVEKDAIRALLSSAPKKGGGENSDGR